MSVFVHTQGIKNVHVGRGWVKNGKILYTQLLNDPQSIQFCLLHEFSFRIVIITYYLLLLYVPVPPFTVLRQVDIEFTFKITSLFHLNMEQFRKKYSFKYRKNKGQKYINLVLRYNQYDTNEISSIANKSKLRHGTYQNSGLKLQPCPLARLNSISSGVVRRPYPA